MIVASYVYVYLSLISAKSVYKEYQKTSMLGALQQLAHQIAQGGPRGPTANEEFTNIIREVGNLSQGLSLLGDSDIYCFVYCSNMIRLIQSGQFSVVSETKSEENVASLNENASHVKLKVYGQIIGELVGLLISTHKPSHIRKSQIDLTALCLKTLFEDSSNFPFLEKIISAFIPHYYLPQNFNTTIETSLQLIVPRTPFNLPDLPQFATLLEIFISMLEYVTIQTRDKTYYEYRRNIYVFKNSYLAYFIYFTVQYTKILFQNYDSSPPMIALMNLVIRLLEQVFVYPFTLSMNQFQLDEFEQNILGSTSEAIYLPNYFRHVICDTKFLEQIYTFWTMTVGNDQNWQEKREVLNSMVKILGRSSCASQYTFKNDDEKKISRQFSVNLLQNMSNNYQYCQSYYLNCIIDMHYKMLAMYDYYFSIQRNRMVDITFSFLYHVLHNLTIKVEEGKNSPFAKIFKLLAFIINSSKDNGEDDEQVKIKSQKILEKAYERLLRQGDNIMNQFGYNQPTEIQCMSEMFQNVGSAFELNLNDNLVFFNQIDIFSLSTGAATLWLHLCSQLLPKTTANLDQTTVIIKYYELVTKGDTLAKLRYIKTMAEYVMGQFYQGEPQTTLWVNMVLISSELDFKKFVNCLLQICLQNFQNPNNQILDYSLELFKTIYIYLKRNDDETFGQFYQLVYSLLQNMQTTIFNRPTHYDKRRQFFHVISVIWINSDTLNYVDQIHQLVSSDIDSATPQSFFQYLYDITGLIEPLDVHQSFEVLTELVLDDLTKLFNIHFQETDKMRFYFSDQMFMKIFCKFIDTFISDINRKLFFQTHTAIPLKISNLVAPVITLLAEGGYEYPNKFINILTKMATLHPLSQLIPFQNISRTLKEQSPEDFQKLITVYFDHIDRVVDITWLYQFIENNVDHMVSWWEEAMVRNMHPHVNFITIVQSHFWTTVMQMETFAKLLYELSYYDKKYWQVDSCLGERAFVEYFSKSYL